ncbi:hypothetical protein ACOME3_006480 [Neoechinorhynchus agilis]
MERSLKPQWYSTLTNYGQKVAEFRDDTSPRISILKLGFIGTSAFAGYALCVRGATKNGIMAKGKGALTAMTVGFITSYALFNFEMKQIMDAGKNSILSAKKHK